MTRTLSIALLTLGDPGRLTGGYLYHRRMAELAPRHGTRIDFVSFPERPFPLATIDAPRVLWQVRRLGARVLLLDSIAAPFLGAPFTLRRPELPLVAMLHQPPGGIDHGQFRTAVQGYLDRLAYRRASRLLVASESLADELVAGGVTRDVLRVVPPGRDVAPRAGPPPADLRQGREAAILCVGNWIERKGIHFLLEALARLPMGAATLHLAGDTGADRQYAARLRARLARPDLADRVTVHGPLSIEAVAALYAAADIFALPSLKEPYGTVYGEAMAFGLPVAGWRTGNLPYLLDDGVEGFMLPLGDIEGLAQALQRLAGDEPLRRRMGEAARLRALARPTWEESARIFFDEIRDVVREG